MRTFSRPHLAALAPLTLLTALSAQNNDSRGLLAGSATTFMVDGGVSPVLTDATALVHGNGISQSPPRFFGASLTAPDLRQILSQYGAPSTLDVDDYSTGRDEILVDQDGYLAVPLNLWSVWSFSLRVGATGEVGSRIAEEADSGSVGAALFSYVLPGSNLPDEVVGRVERSHSRGDLGIPGGPSTEIDAIDTPLVLGLDQDLLQSGGATDIEPNWEPLIGVPQYIFFTVSHETRHLVPMWWWSPAEMSGATILVTTRSTHTGPWSAPTVFKSFNQLGLDQDEDIDALAVEPTNERLLFSTTGNLRDQFLFLDLSSDGGMPPMPLPVRKGDGTKVSDSVGKADGDDIDAVCTLDPRLNDVGEMEPGGDDFGSSCGVPRMALFGPPELDGSAFRRYRNGFIFFDSFMVGWPESTGPAPGFALAFLTFDDTLDLIPIGGVHLRNPANIIAGDPHTETVEIPPSLALTNARMTFRWVHIDGTAFTLHEVRPVQVFL